MNNINILLSGAFAINLLYNMCWGSSSSNQVDDLAPALDNVTKQYKNDYENNRAKLVNFPKAHQQFQNGSAREFIDQLVSPINSNLKQHHIQQFHDAYNIISQPDHSYENYQRNFFKAYCLSGYIASNILDDSNNLKSDYESVALHLDLIKRKVMYGGSYFFETVAGRSPNNKCLYRRPINLTPNYVDPLGRVNLDKYHLEWEEMIEENKVVPPFPLWILQKDSQIQKYLQIQTPFGLKPNLKTIININEKKFINISNGRNLYVIKDQEFHTHPMSGMNHDRLMGFYSVECAGEIEAHNGKITFISNFSGHYRPSPYHLLSTVNYLHKNDLFDDNANIDFYFQNNTDSQEKLSINIKELDASKLQRVFRDNHTYRYLTWRKVKSFGYISYKLQDPSNFNLNDLKNLK